MIAVVADGRGVMAAAMGRCGEEQRKVINLIKNNEARLHRKVPPPRTQAGAFPQARG
jgi:hypothetical protein